jgi:uncharacterized protein (TIGR02421 family)
MSQAAKLVTLLDVISKVVESIESETPVRLEFGDGGRVHIDRPLPFVCLHLFCTDRPALAAHGIAVSNAAHILADDEDQAMTLVNAVAPALIDRFGAMAVVQFSEFAEDTLLQSDSPFLAPFDLCIADNGFAGAGAVVEEITNAIEQQEVRFRTPLIRREALSGRAPEQSRVAWIEIRMSPIYRQPESDDVYPELLAAIQGGIFDAALRGLKIFCDAASSLSPVHHRALGRRVFIDAVTAADKKLNAIHDSFDFLLSVTPINSDMAWRQFSAAHFASTPRFLYRPLAVSTDHMKRRLHSVDLDQLEDPVLIEMFQEKQNELDLQLTMLQARNTRSFLLASQMLYGDISPALREAAGMVLAAGQDTPRQDSCGGDAIVGCEALQSAARAKVEYYRSRYDRFTPEVCIRNDLPAGLLVSGPRLLISNRTSIPADRVDAILEHEVGVHLLTYFNGAAQGLQIFRAGLAGYEGFQEGLAVFAEYAVGGLTLARLRTLAGRVVACDAVIGGADFVDTHRLLVDDYGFGPRTGFNIALRVHRSGGLTKDAIYLQGLLEVLRSLPENQALSPFWMGKIARRHLPVVDELSDRGMLGATPLVPSFVDRKQGRDRIARARTGLSPVDLIAA